MTPTGEGWDPPKYLPVPICDPKMVEEEAVFDRGRKDCLKRCNYVVGVRISPNNVHPCSQSESSIHPDNFLKTGYRLGRT